MSFNIISKILEVYDKNIKFDEEFCENEVIRGVEHKIFQGKLTYVNIATERLQQKQILQMKIAIYQIK